MIQMSNLKVLQSKVRQESMQKWGKFAFDSDLDKITESLLPMRKPEMTDSDFIEMTLETINTVYGCDTWYDSTKIIEPVRR